LGALPMPVIPDYKKSVEDVYVEFTAYLVVSGHLSSLLSQRGSSEQRRRKDGLGITTDLPSWVPDFSLYGFRELSKHQPSFTLTSLMRTLKFGLKGYLRPSNPSHTVKDCMSQEWSASKLWKNQRLSTTRPHSQTSEGSCPERIMIM
jgi:hypothetical protein